MKGYQIPGLPEGYELVRFQIGAKQGDIVIGAKLEAKELAMYTMGAVAIIRPIFDFAAFWNSLSFLPAGTWIAKDSIGVWWAYSHKPAFSNDTWRSGEGACFRLNYWPFKDIQFPDLSPADSLLRKPEAE